MSPGNVTANAGRIALTTVGILTAIGLLVGVANASVPPQKGAPLHPQHSAPAGGTPTATIVASVNLTDDLNLSSQPGIGSLNATIAGEPFGTGGYILLNFNNTTPVPCPCPNSPNANDQSVLSFPFSGVIAGISRGSLLAGAALANQNGGSAFINNGPHRFSGLYDAGPDGEGNTTIIVLTGLPTTPIRITLYTNNDPNNPLRHGTLSIYNGVNGGAVRIDNPAGGGNVTQWLLSGSSTATIYQSNGFGTFGNLPIGGILFDSDTGGTPTPTGTTTPISTPTRTATATPTIMCTPDPNYSYTSSVGATVIPGTSQVPGSVCDECVVTINVPFPYFLYGQSFPQVIASNKGNLQLNSSNSTGANTCLPTTQLHYTILPFWDDLNTNVNDVMGIYTRTMGTAPNRTFIIEWRAGQVANDVTYNFEVLLYEGQERFDFIYGQVLGAGNGISATIGVQRDTGSLFTHYSCNTPSLQTGLRLTFERRICLVRNE